MNLKMLTVTAGTCVTVALLIRLATTEYSSLNYSTYLGEFTHDLLLDISLILFFFSLYLKQ
jgi:hypothetical protein